MTCEFFCVNIKTSTLFQGRCASGEESQDDEEEEITLKLNGLENLNLIRFQINDLIIVSQFDSPSSPDSAFGLSVDGEATGKRI
jgi:hypothetical protein